MTMTMDVDKAKEYAEALKGDRFDSDTVYEIPMDHVYADEGFNVRGTIQPLEVIELAKEIKQKGLIQPITVQPFNLIPGKRWRIVAGYRRHKAHQVNAATTIRALIKTGLSDLDARLMNLVENTQREQLNIVQEAKAIEFFKFAGWTQDQVAVKVGKSRGWAQTRYYLLDLPTEIQEEAKAGLLNQADIHNLWRLKDFGYDAQMAALKDLKEKKARGKVKSIKPEDYAPPDQDKKLRTRPEIFEIQERIQEMLGDCHLAAKALGWAAGEIDREELEDAIKYQANCDGRIYTDC